MYVLINESLDSGNANAVLSSPTTDQYPIMRACAQIRHPSRPRSSTMSSRTDIPTMHTRLGNTCVAPICRRSVAKDHSQLLPNDEKEQDRLDLQHHIFRLILGGDISRTKLKEPHRIIDIGTGTGIWALDAGDLYPEAEVIGVDLSPIQPNWTAPNVKFEIDDITQPWTWESNSMDFIHVRTMGGSIKDWPGFLQECYK